MSKVILFGNGGAASVAYFFLTQDSPYKVVAFTVDRQYLKEDTFLDLPVVPFEQVEALYPPDEYKMLIAVGYGRVNRLRGERYYQTKEKGYELINYVSSNAIIWPKVVIGENCVIGPNTLIFPFVEIGNNVVIGSGSTIGHHSIIKDHCFIGDNVAVAGSVTVEPYCFLGIGTTIKNKVTIARECVIGAGAVILENTQKKEVYLGKPADLLPISSDELPIG